MSTLSEKAKEILNSLPFWEKMAGSQFIQGLALLIEKLGESYVQRCERALAESRFSTASNRSSILAGAQDKGYVPRKVAPSTGKVAITNKAGIPIGIPIGEKISSKNGTPYLLLDAVNLDVGANVEAEVAQIEIQVFEYSVDKLEEYLEVTLSPAISSNVHKLVVYVKNTQNDGFVEWNESYMFRGANAQSRVYTEFYTPLEQLGVRFGNGVDGMMPPIGAIIKIEAWLTKGATSLMQGEVLSFENEAVNDLVAVSSSTPVVGGQAAESTESVRVSAQYATQYDNQIVWGDDYIHFIRENVGQFEFLNVWGEEQQEKQDGVMKIENINRVFISAAAQGKTSAEVEALIIPKLVALNRFSRNYKFVPPTEKAIPVTIKAKIAPTVSLNDAQSKLIQMINAKFGRARAANPDGTETLVLKKNIWTEIDKLGLFEDFSLDVAILNTEPKLEEFRFIDTATSSITITYGAIY